MKEIALAIMVIGLCFYNGWLDINNKERDSLAAFFSIIGAIALLWQF